MDCHSLPSVGDASRLAQHRLNAFSPTPGLDAQVLLAFILSKPRPWVLAHPEIILSPQECQNLESALDRLEHGLPLPYLLGSWEFFGLDFIVTPQVLIPRPESEHLVELGLDWLKNSPQAAARSHCWRVVDVGTGSGCIAINLAVNLPELHILAVDISAAALRVARANAERHLVSNRLVCVQSDLLSAWRGPFDLICANLPYVPSGYSPRPGDPDLALDGGPDGLTLIRRLVRQAARLLAPQGLLLMEIESSQGQAVYELICEQIVPAEVKILPDLAGHDRVALVQKYPASNK